MAADRDELISQFCQLTSAAPHDAENYLGAAEWNLDAAVSEFFTSQEEEADTGDVTVNTAPEPVPGGGRTLGGEGAPSVHVPAALPAAASGSRAGASTQGKKKFSSLRDLAGGGPARGADDDDDDDDQDDGPEQDFYAGGEKSGLAVQNPDDLKRKILEKARQQQGRPRDEPPAVQRSAFTGRAQTLGGDDAPSQVVDDPNAEVPQPAARVERTLHFWQDGFSVDDGALYRNDDPQNAARLEMIRQGRAPYDILNVAYDQEADVKLEQHDTPYVKPKQKFVPFSGQGQRLGSPAPGLSRAVEPPRPAASAPAQSSSEPPKMDVDDSQPTISLQIRLGDGTRLVSRFNTTHTVGDIYSFVSASNLASQSQQWALMTTFPSKELTDKSQVLGEMADFKRGGTVVQKWK